MESQWESKLLWLQGAQGAVAAESTVEPTGLWLQMAEVCLWLHRSLEAVVAESTGDPKWLRPQGAQVVQVAVAADCMVQLIWLQRAQAAVACREHRSVAVAAERPMIVAKQTLRCERVENPMNMRSYLLTALFT